uniref:Uncharacterized protein n=1 Tax=Comamonas sp. KV36 TaxID=1170709 RepID=I1Z148_9BURK|nr:hypothetical protein pKV36_12 [Comamonas sp. KV36]
MMALPRCDTWPHAVKTPIRAQVDFDPYYERVRAAADYVPGDVLASDTVFSRGTGIYHLHKRQGMTA